MHIGSLALDFMKLLVFLLSGEVYTASLQGLMILRNDEITGYSQLIKFVTQNKGNKQYGDGIEVMKCPKGPQGGKDPRNI